MRNLAQTHSAQDQPTLVADEDIDLYSPKAVYEVDSAGGLWDLAKEEYPNDNVSHFFVLIVYMCAFYGLLHLILHGINIKLNKRYGKLDAQKRGEYRSHLISPVHSVMCVIFSILAMFYVCGGG